MLSPTLSQRYIRNQSLVTKYRLFSIQNAFEIAHLPDLINCSETQLPPFDTYGVFVAVRMLPAPADACPSLPEASLAGAGAKACKPQKAQCAKDGSCGCSTLKAHTPHGDPLSHGQF